nr:MAG TPA: hypothetical protein [Caudoviricetes sp.]
MLFKKKKGVPVKEHPLAYLATDFFSLETLGMVSATVVSVVESTALAVTSECCSPAADSVDVAAFIPPLLRRRQT